MMPERNGGTAVNWIGTEKELSKEEIQRLEVENVLILHARFVD